MYKVLIAEDEMFVRLGVKMSVDWGKLGMEVIADVENGIQALEVYEKERPDIIVTDIKMPILDGIGLIKKIRKKDERTRFIILSCMEEFNIVREAISLGVSDYVLKLSMTQTDMEKVLEKSKKELSILDKGKEEKDNKQSKRKLEENLKTFLYYQMEMNGEMGDWLREKFSSEDHVMRMLVMEIDNFENCKKIFNDSYGKILNSAVENILSELLLEENQILLMEQSGRTVILLEDTERGVPSRHLLDLLEKIREVLKRCIKTSVSFGISETTGHYEELHELYHQCVTALEMKFFYGVDRNHLWKSDNQENCEQTIRRKMNRMLQNLKTEDPARQQLLEAEAAFCQHRNPITIRHFFEHLVNARMCSILPEGQTRYQISERFVGQVTGAQTFDEILEIYEKCSEYLMESSDEKEDISKPVKDILLYISQHYAEDITLEQLADMVELSRTYVCGLFKKEMNINITNYIMGYRVEKAQELFRNTNLKSYEIAEKVGFMDESYFSRTFKKVTGQSPNTYKRGCVKVWE